MGQASPIKIIQLEYLDSLKQPNPSISRTRTHKKQAEDCTEHMQNSLAEYATIFCNWGYYCDCADENYVEEEIGARK